MFGTTVNRLSINRLFLIQATRPNANKHDTRMIRRLLTTFYQKKKKKLLKLLNRYPLRRTESVLGILRFRIKVVVGI